MGLWHHNVLYWPILVSLSTFSFLSMLACALTLYSVMDCVLCYGSSTIYFNIVLYEWLLCCVGCLICVVITYKPFRQFVKM